MSDLSGPVGDLQPAGEPLKLIVHQPTSGAAHPGHVENCALCAPSVGPVGDLPAVADQLAIMGDWLVGKVDGCTCAPFEGQHEPHCGWEPCAPLAVIVAMVEPLIRAHIADELRELRPAHVGEGNFQAGWDAAVAHVARGAGRG